MTDLDNLLVYLIKHWLDAIFSEEHTSPYLSKMGLLLGKKKEVSLWGKKTQKIPITAAKTEYEYNFSPEKSDYILTSNQPS